MTTVGLLLIFIAWILQWICLQRSSQIDRLFVLGYGAGTALLILDSVLMNSYLIAALNLLVLIAVFLVLWTIMKGPIKSSKRK